MPTFLQRLKERKIVQWAIVYLAGAWLFLEALGFVADTFAWPAFVARTAVVLAAVGFFVALVLAWYHGEKGRQRVSAVELLILTGILVIAGLLVTVLRPRAGGEPEVPEPSAFTVSESGRPSVAALPFEHRSALEEDRWFTDGIHEQILTQLSKVGGLSVRGRTSAMAYRDSPKNLRQIGRELDARYVLEGSVFREGETVRINVQLIDAQQDEHLWAEDYDRDLSVESLLAVQSDIAERVAQALEAELTPGQRAQIEAKPTDNLEAYEYYLRGRALSHGSEPFRSAEFDAAVGHLQRAVELDPDFATAWGYLAELWLYLSWSRMDPDLRDRGVEALDRAIDLAPEAFNTYVARSTYYRFAEHDYERELENIRAAERLRPNDVLLLSYKGWALIFAGQWGEGLAAIEEAVVLDPLNPDFAQNLARLHGQLGNFAEAERYFDRAIALDPSDPAHYDWKFSFLLESLGDTARAREFAEQHPERSKTWLAWLAYLSRDYEKALELYRSDPVIPSRLDISPAHAYPSSWRVIQIVYKEMNEPARVRAIADSVLPFFEARLNRLIEAGAGPRSLAIIHLTLGAQYADLGDREAAIRQAEMAETYLPSADAWIHTTLVSGVASIYRELGEYDRAMDYLEEMLSVPTRWSAECIRIDPAWDPLRDHPRFQALLAKYE
jgi:TolB-like protein/Tfp pilus assembly protein PilF